MRTGYYLLVSGFNRQIVNPLYHSFEQFFYLVLVYARKGHPQIVLAKRYQPQPIAL